MILSVCFKTEKSLEKRMKEMIAPFIAEVMTLKDDLPENEGALKRIRSERATDPHKKAARRSMQH